MNEYANYVIKTRKKGKANPLFLYNSLLIFRKKSCILYVLLFERISIMHNLEQALQHSHTCRPTDASVLSVCARSMAKSTADAAKILYCLADAAFAVSVFVFIGVFTAVKDLMIFCLHIMAMPPEQVLRLCLANRFYTTIRFYVYCLYDNERQNHPHKRSAYSLG